MSENDTQEVNASTEAANVAEATNKAEETTNENATVEPETFPKEYVTELRAEAANYRTNLRDAQAKASSLEEQIAELTKANETTVKESQTALEAANINALRLRVALNHGVPVEDAELFLTATDEETLIKQAERLSARTPVIRPDSAQGKRTGNSATSPKDAFARAWEEARG